MSRLTNIFASVLGIEEASVGAELSPENTPSWDSLNAIVLITEIEKAFNVRFEYDEVMAVKNFADAQKLTEVKGGDINV
ncbi:MAG: phosphopantetheine-binding protein [Parcubacteria group bacterium GW2011_GWA2_47_7]|nr:MAG: phosphopantetheine-binding protein [Parcubacteria group bacterium GW2011_GWA2_47_7]